MYVLFQLLFLLCGPDAGHTDTGIGYFKSKKLSDNLFSFSDTKTKEQNAHQFMLVTGVLHQ